MAGNNIEEIGLDEDLTLSGADADGIVGGGKNSCAPGTCGGGTKTNTKAGDKTQVVVNYPTGG